MNNIKWDLNKKSKWSSSSLAHVINEIINQHFVVRELNGRCKNYMEEIEEILLCEHEFEDMFDEDGFAKIDLEDLTTIIDAVIYVFVNRRI